MADSSTICGSQHVSPAGTDRPAPIPPVTGETAYELLGPGPAASAALVEAAYRIRCAELAASSLSPTSVARPGRAVESAYAVLREPRRRAIYDLELGRDPAADDAAPGGTLPRVRTCWRCGEVL